MLYIYYADQSRAQIFSSIERSQKLRHDDAEASQKHTSSAGFNSEHTCIETADSYRPEYGKVSPLITPGKKKIDNRGSYNNTANSFPSLIHSNKKQRKSQDSVQLTRIQLSKDDSYTHRESSSYHLFVSESVKLFIHVKYNLESYCYIYIGMNTKKSKTN